MDKRKIVTWGCDEIEVVEDRHAGYCALTKGRHPLLAVALIKDGKRSAVIAMDLANATALRDALTEALGAG